MRADRRRASRVPNHSGGCRRGARARRPSPVPRPPAAALPHAQRPAEPWPRRTAVEKQLDTPIAQSVPKILVANTRSSSLFLFPFPHQLSDGERILITALLKGGDDARAIGCGTVLAQLELAFQPADGNVEADDPLHHALE